MQTTSEQIATAVSVVVPCRNEVRYIRSFLESLVGQRRDGLQVEALLADGESDDGTRAILDEYHASHPWIRVLGNPGRTVSAGLNTAVREARGDIVIRMDAHSRYASDYLQRCVEVLNSSGADNAGGPARTEAAGWVSRAIAAAYHSKFACGGARFHDTSYEGPVDTVPYGCWRKQTLEALGLFDETLLRNQDDELNLRILRRGGSIWQSPRIVSWYCPRGSLGSLFRQYFQYGFWKVAVIRKHRLPASWRHLAPASFVLGNAVMGTGSMLGNFWLARTWQVTLSFYAAAAFGASLRAAAIHGWKLLPVLPLVFAIYHVSYGLGFVFGVLHQVRRVVRPGPPAKWVTEITR